jgi:thioester reductase-like protein
VLLTGATGFLGSHILALLCKDVKVDRVYCLVRADSDGAAGRRVAQSLKDRGLASVEDGHSNRIACISSRLDEENLGLSVEAQDLLLREHPPTHIIHSAWAVNFALRLDSFESQIASMVNMLNLAVEIGAHFTFVSSTAAVTESSVRLGGGPIPETQSQDPGDASPLGYSQSKWVAEHICAAAAAAARNTSQSCHHPQGATLRESPVSVARVGQLCSNAEGIWNMSEAYPLMLSTARITGCLPNLESEVLSWLPVQVAAQAVVEASAARGDPDADRVLHILNSNHMPSWAQMLAWIQEDVASQGAHLDLVTPEEWLRRLEEALPQHPHHPSQALLGLWKEGMLGDARSDRKAPLEFCLDVTKATLPAMSNVVPLGRHQILGMWHWVREQRL